MKKIIVWAMLLALAVSMLAGCANTTPAQTAAPTEAKPVETQAPTEPESGLADAVAYVKTIYKNAAEITAKDYEVISVVPMGTESFEIAWTVDVAEDVVAVAAGEGVKQLFLDLGVNNVVSGGQTMNPSIEDILDAIHGVRANNVIVLPNNSNVILAASQAAELADSVVEVVYSIPVCVKGELPCV